MSFSFCIITKNERLNIEKCIEALLPCGQEIVVVDTGSTDGTKEYLNELSIKAPLLKVFHFVWIDDFSAAKNFAISQAANEHVFVVDSDEFLTEIDVNQVETLIQNNSKDVGRIRRCNLITADGIKQENIEWINRIFSRKLYHYVGSIHEQITSYSGTTYECYRIPSMLLHTGYDLSKEELKKKAHRNIDLLNKELESIFSKINCTDIYQFEGKKPELNSIEEQIPYLLYQLGKSFYMIEDYEKAIDFWNQALIFDLNPKLEYVIDMVETYGYALINSKRAQEALAFEGIYENFISADFVYLMGLIYMNNAMFDKAIGEFKKATRFKEARIKGVNSFSAYYNIGVIYECLGMKDDAIEWYKKSEEYKPAKIRLKGLLG